MKIPVLYKTTCQCCGRHEYTTHALDAMGHICKFCDWENDALVESDVEESDSNNGLSLKDYRYIHGIKKTGVVKDSSFLTPLWWYNRSSRFNSYFHFAR